MFLSVFVQIKRHLIDFFKKKTLTFLFQGHLLLGLVKVFVTDGHPWSLSAW